MPFTGQYDFKVGVQGLPVVQRPPVPERATAWMADTFVRPFYAPLTPDQITQRLTSVRRILVLRTHYLGDMITFTPVLRGLRMRFPEAEIRLVASTWGGALVKQSKWVDRIDLLCEDEIRTAPRRDILDFFRALRRDGPIDLALASSQEWHHARAAEGLFATGASLRVGLRTGRKGYLYNVPVPFPKDNHEVRQNIVLLEALGMDHSDERTEVPVSEESRAWTRNRLRSAGLETRRPRIGIHVGAKAPNRLWLTDRYAQLADRLVRDTSASIILTGGAGKEDRERAAQVRALMTQPVCDWVGEVPVEHWAAVTEALDLYIVPDTGAMHLGIALNIPTLALLGPGNFGWWADYRNAPNFRYLRGPCPEAPCALAECADPKCMKAIEVDAVFSEARKMLEARHG